MNLPRITNPCPADFDKMPLVQNGHFCSSCCKVVVDFTKKTTSEIFEYLKSHTGTCGKFRPSQVQPITVPGSQKFTWRLKRFSIALYFVFGSLLFSLASCGGGLDDSTRLLDDSLHYANMNAQYKQTQDSLRQDSIVQKSGSAKEQN